MSVGRFVGYRRLVRIDDEVGRIRESLDDDEFAAIVARVLWRDGGAR